MGILIGILFSIEAVISVLLIGIILLQKSKDEGLGLAFGAGVGETLFGSRAGNVLSKITIGLAASFLLITIWIGYLLSGSARSISVTDRLPGSTAPMQRPAPAQQQAPAEPAGAATSEQPVAAPAAEAVPVPAAPAAPATPAVPAAPEPSQGAKP